MVITDLIVNKKDKSNVDVYVKNKFYCVMNMDTVVKNNLKVGLDIDDSKLQKMQWESDKNNAFNKALKLINTRYKTKKEIYKYLEEKGYLPQTIFYCLDKLMEYNYVDDEKYALSYINHHKTKSGKLKLKQELLQKGVSEDIIDTALKEMDSQAEEIKILAEKYMKSKEDTKENYLKLYKYLLTKGFEYEEITRVLREEE